MRFSTLAAAALIVLAGPVLAQEAVAAPSPDATPSAPAKSAEELAIEAQAVEFRTALGRMQEELVAATTRDEGDTILARYQPQADALADRINAFLVAHANEPANEAQRGELLTQAVIAVQRVRGIPALIRNTIDEGKARAAAEAAAPAAPAAAPTA